ncbi:MAG: hypothetical protein HY827_02825 [Actinobacteria bacterium]|nr:hypothetical protein [Actinomycetota bacterium]
MLPLVLAFTCIFLFHPNAPAASADEWAISPCSGEYAEEFWTRFTSWTDPDPYIEDPPPWQLAFECPHRIVVQQPGSNTWHLPFTWGYFLDQEGRGPVKRVTALLQSGTLEANVTTGIQACSSQACSPPLSPDPALFGTRQPISLSADNGLLPEGSDRLMITAQCADSDPCSPADAMSIYDLRIVRDDDQKPNVDINGAPADASPVNTYLRLNNWNNGKKLIDAEVRDSNSGVRTVHTTVSGWQLLDDLDCGRYSSIGVDAGCPTEFTLERSIDLPVIAPPAHMLDGSQTLTVYARDAAGNESEPVTASFKLDRRAPLIESLTASSALPGRDTDERWQSSPYASFKWRNTPENAESATMSGVAGFAYALHRIETSPAVPVVPKIAEPMADSFNDLEITGEGLWRFTLWTFDRAGNRSDRRSTLIGYDTTIPDAPSVDPIAMLGLNSVSQGVTADWDAPANLAAIESQVCNYAATVDSNPLTDPGIDGTIPGNATSHTFFPPLLRDTLFLHIRAHSCAGIAGRILHVPINVDPDAPTIIVSGPSSSGWYVENEPPTISISDERLGVVSASYSIDGGDPKTIDRGFASLDLGDGNHTLTVTASDDVGNVATSRTTLRVDRSPPQGVVLPASNLEPQKVQAVSTDRQSGVSGAKIQFRSEQDTDWHDLAGSLAPQQDSETGWLLTSLIPDLSLANGAYALRVVSIDHAGNKGEAYGRIDGSIAGFAIPLRSKPILTVGFRTTVGRRKCARPARRKRCANSDSTSGTELQPQKLVNYGRTAELVGHLHDTSGLPVANAELVLRESGIGWPSRITQRTHSNDDGSFAFKPNPGMSRTLNVAFAGTPLLLPTQASATLFSRGKVTLRVTSKQLNSRASVTLVGRVFAIGATFPKLGKRVEFQYRVGRQWRELPIDVHTDSRGFFTAKYVFGHLDRPVRWTFRAVVGPEDSWPYESASSSAISKVVGG